LLGRILAQLLICGCSGAAGVAATAIAVPVSRDATVTPELRVTAPARGAIESRLAGIACGADCYAAFAGGGAVTLTPRGGPPGYAPDWSVCAANSAGRCAGQSFSCDSEAGGRCELEMSDRFRVSLVWRDATAPSVSLDSPPARAGPATTFTARARDNSRAVSAVRFFVDGGLVATDTEPPFRTRLPVRRYPQASTHRLTAQAFDAAGSSGVTRPHRFDIDIRARPAFLAATPRNGAHVNRVPSFAFRTQADVPAGGVVCRILPRGGGIFSTIPCSSPYVAQATSDGPYAVQLRFNDDVGNTSVYTRRFTLDRRAPGLAVAWPAPGGVLRPGFSPRYRAADETTPARKLRAACKLDGGRYRRCGPVHGPPGAHTLFVRVRDRAGNADVAWVRFRLARGAPGRR
jgi:Bacterial Ig domain